MKHYSLILILILSFQTCFGFSGEPQCAFTGGGNREAGQSPSDPGPDPKDSMTPYAENHPPKVASSSAKYLKEVGPNYDGKEVCCNDDQILVLYNNFKTIDSLFGNCLICSTNLKRFWCEFTCSPYQAHFVNAYDQIQVSDVDFPVLNLTMTIGNMVAGDLYDACKKNPYVTSLASGQSAIGFLEFMGSNAVQTGKTKISFLYSNEEEHTMIEEMYPCDMDVQDTLDGYEVEPCTGNYCEAACKPSKSHAFPAFFDGFNYVVVIIVYVSLIILSIIIHFAKKKWMQKHSETESVEQSNEYTFEDSRDSQDDSQKQLIPKINESRNISMSQHTLVVNNSES